jgi:hypothetical protein
MFITLYTRLLHGGLGLGGFGLPLPLFVPPLPLPSPPLPQLTAQHTPLPREHDDVPDERTRLLRQKSQRANDPPQSKDHGKDDDHDGGDDLRIHDASAPGSLRAVTGNSAIDVDRTGEGERTAGRRSPLQKSLG